MLHSKLKFASLLVAFYVAGALLLSPKVLAQEKSYEFDNVDVEITINSDSTFEVTERITYRFSGEFHAVNREITLEDIADRQACVANMELQCGGFEFLGVIGVYDDSGTKLDEDDYTVSEINTNNQRRLKIEYIFSQEGINFNDETYTFTIKYKVFGGLGYFPAEGYDLFYWNALFEDRSEMVNNLDVRIKFPKDIDIDYSDLNVPGNPDFRWSYDSSDAILSFNEKKLIPDQSYTILVKIPEGVVAKYATLKLSKSPEQMHARIGSLELLNIPDNMAGLPAGKTTITFFADGYKEQSMVLDLKSGETKDLTVQLEPTLFTRLYTFALVFCNCLGCLIFPLITALIYWNWRRIGRDKGRKATIVPQYNPPADMKPYMLGSVKDEKVDLIDITATIIDLAYRGYLKIREFKSQSFLGFELKGKSYEFIKLKEFSDLSLAEQEIMNGVFSNGVTRATTEDLRNKFYTKIPRVTELVYQEMVDKNYFSKRPDQIRQRYYLISGGIILLGIGFAALSPYLPFFVASAVALITAGVAGLFVARHMPAKTEEGSQAYDHVLGFRMYIHTAERFRVQNLTPETFERFLAYAIVFGIEKMWAEKFKDIYTGKPEWFETDSDVFSTIYLANALSNFSHIAATSMSTSPNNSSGSSFGGGWSGGGGFSGGFSGGGGGGGSAGAW